ncbi:MAG TPA: hypothetical protein VGP44_07265 [Gemmatimonadales bacterium]|nr:hypothetical protein [Gemmatimonadales bacterium]
MSASSSPHRQRALLWIVAVVAVIALVTWRASTRGTHQQRVLGVFTIGLGLMFTGVLGRIPLLARSFRLGYRPQVGVA